MLTVAFIATKGGVGKSSTSVNLATLLHEQGRAVVVVDIDPQESSADWARVRGGRPPPVISGLPERLTDMLATAQHHNVEVVIVDTAGHASKGAVVAASLADIVVVPTRASAVDMFGIRHTVDLLTTANAMDKAVAMLLVSNRKSAEIADAKQALGVVNMPYLDAMLVEAEIYKKTFKKGLAVIEQEPDGGAAGDLKAVWKAIEKRATKKEKGRG